eukprot:2023350-Prymnesium_polylepis.1
MRATAILCAVGTAHLRHTCGFLFIPPSVQAVVTCGFLTTVSHTQARFSAQPCLPNPVQFSTEQLPFSERVEDAIGDTRFMDEKGKKVKGRLYHRLRERNPPRDSMDVDEGGGGAARAY